MRTRTLLALLGLLVLAAGMALAQTNIALSGKQIRGVPGRDAQLVSTGVMLPRAGTISQVACGGDGFWIEDDMGVVNEWRVPAQAVGAPLDAGGPYRVYPFLKKDQDETSVSVTVTMP